jgi:uncharacterized protein (TIGR03435 family)
MKNGAIAAIVFCLAAPGQTGGALPSFDVASVKPNNGAMDHIETGTARHGEVILHNASMDDCIRYAYGLASNDQISGPAWMAAYQFRFDILAKAPPDTPQGSLLPMMQRLLAERFHLALHRESKLIAHLEIGVAKGGPRLPQVAEEPAAPRYIYGRGLLNYPHTTMRELAMLLSMQLRQPVLDRTALEGFYDIKLEWRPDDPLPVSLAPEAAAPEIDGRPDLFQAMALLGLKLTPSKAPIEVLVVDRVDQTPAEN